MPLTVDKKIMAEVAGVAGDDGHIWLGDDMVCAINWQLGVAVFQDGAGTGVEGVIETELAAGDGTGAKLTAGDGKVKLGRRYVELTTDAGVPSASVAGQVFRFKGAQVQVPWDKLAEALTEAANAVGAADSSGAPYVRLTVEGDTLSVGAGVPNGERRWRKPVFGRFEDAGVQQVPDSTTALGAGFVRSALEIFERLRIKDVSVWMVGAIQPVLFVGQAGPSQIRVTIATRRDDATRRIRDRR